MPNHPGDVDLASIALLQINEGYSWARSKFYIGDLPGIRSPIHITRDYVTVAENALYYGNVPCPGGGSLYSGLQVYDSSYNW